MEEIPVYLFTGFMDSGKTSLIHETLFENDFGGGDKTLIVCCEDGDTEYDELLHQLPKLQAAEIIHIDFATLPEVEIQGVYAEVTMEKQEWKARVKEQVKQILRYKPEAVFVGENLFAAYPIVHALRKKHIPVLVAAEKDGQKLIVRIPSGS